MTSFAAVQDLVKLEVEDQVGENVKVTDKLSALLDDDEFNDLVRATNERFNLDLGSDSAIRIDMTVDAFSQEVYDSLDDSDDADDEDHEDDQL